MQFFVFLFCSKLYRLFGTMESTAHRPFENKLVMAIMQCNAGSLYYQYTFTHIHINTRQKMLRRSRGANKHSKAAG